MAQIGNCSSDQFGIVNDAVCCTVELDGTAVAGDTIWTNDTIFVMNGTIMVENNGIVGVSPSVTLSVNGTAVPDFTVAPGECRSITINGLTTITVTGTGGTGTTVAKVSFSLNYKF